MVRRKNLCSSVRSVGDKIIIRGGRNDLSVGKDITDPLYLPLKIRLSERRRSLFVLPSERILSKAGGLVCPLLDSLPGVWIFR